MAIRLISLPGRGPITARGSLVGHCQLPYMGNPTAQIMVVVDPIVYEGDEAPAANVPMNSKVLGQMAPYMKSVGLNGKDFVFVAACGPVHKDVWTSDSKLSKEIKEQHLKFREAFVALKPRLIIAQGKAAIRQVLNRPAKITKLRGVAFHDEHLDTIVMPMLGIGHVARVPEHGELFEADLRTVKGIIDNGFKMAKAGPAKNYKWCTDLDVLIARGSKLLSVDIESSTGVSGEFPHWYNPRTKIMTVQISDRAGESFVVPIDYPGYPITPTVRAKLVAQLKQLLENPEIKIVGQNFKYDWIVLLRKLGIKVANYEDDILLMTHMLNENMLSKSLDDIARVYLPEMGGYKDEFTRTNPDKSRMDLVSPEHILAYSGADTDCALQLYHILKKKLLADPKIWNCYRKVVMPALRAFCDIEQRGFKVNRTALEALRVQVEAKQKSEGAFLLSAIPKVIRDEFENTGVGLKLTRDVLLRAFLFTHPAGLKLKPTQFTKGTKQPSVSTKTHLPYFAGKYTVKRKMPDGTIANVDWISSLMAYVKNDKMLTTYIGQDRHFDENGNVVEATGFWQYINNGHINPSYLLHRTVTGRSASEGPNGQNFPKRGEFAKLFRAIFEAPDGWVLLEADYSQLELRIAGILANEPTFLRIYKEGGDIHCMTAAIVMGISLDAFMALKQSDPEKFALGRFRAKAVNFGFLYGMGWRKFMVYAKTEYGIDYTEEEARNIREAFFTRYRFKDWHDAVKEFVRIHKYVRCIDGRMRHLPAVAVDDDGVAQSAERMAVNSPVQGFGSDLGLIALARINAGLPQDLVRVIGFIHDAVVCIAKKGREMEAARAVKNYMETNPLKEWFGFTSPIPILADVSLGPNLAKMIELKGAWIKDETVKTFEQVKALDDAGKQKKPVQEPAHKKVVPGGLRIIKLQDLKKPIAKAQKAA